MATQQLHRIAQIKLGELRRQEQELKARYDELEGSARAETMPLSTRLETLLCGLKELTFAGVPLHPAAYDIHKQLAVLLLEASYGRGDEVLLQRAMTRLLEELERGRVRVSFAHLFGRLIQEHLGASEQSVPRVLANEQLLALFQSSPEKLSRMEEWLQRTLGARSRALKPLRARLSELHEPLLVRPLQECMEGLLEEVARTPLSSPSLRLAAKTSKKEEGMAGELVDVLAILLERLDDWRWPEEGVALRGEVTHGKERVSLEEKLLDALLLTHIGNVWSGVVSSWRQDAGLPRFDPDNGLFLPFHRLPLPELVPEALAAHNLDFIEQALDISLAQESHRLSMASLMEEGLSYERSSFEQRSKQDELLACVQAHLQTSFALNPEKHRWVLRFDLQDFFPSIPHEAIFACLRHLHTSPRWLQFFERYLAVPARHGGQTFVVRRGLFAGRRLGWVLAEILLLPLEIAVQEATGLRLLRVGDDAFLMALTLGQIEQAWGIVQDFVESFGLKLNPEKCGAVCVSARGEAPATPESLPQALPRWGALRLHSDGVWRADAGWIEALRGWTYRRVSEAPSSLEAVNRYNRELLFLARSLAISTRLDRDNLDRVARILIDFHQNFAGPGRGIGELLQERSRGLAAHKKNIAEIPAPLLHWPVTAGGLGLLQPMILVQAFLHTGWKTIQNSAANETVYWANALKSQNHLARAALVTFVEHRLQARAEFWLNAARELAGPLVMEGPQENAQIQPLITDFIQRGTELGGRQQKGLSPYWRHVLHTYGPPLLDAVGTFRFLLTELVPLPLLFRKSNESLSLGSEDAAL